MNIKPIHTRAEHEAALKAIAPVFARDPMPGTPEGDWLEIMVTLIENYENKHYPISPPEPVEAIKFRMEQQGLTAADLAPAIGRTNRVYEVLSGKRQLTLPMIRNLHSMFNIPLESLVGFSQKVRPQA